MKKGEIAILLTTVVLLVIGATTLISSLVLKGKKTTGTKAAPRIKCRVDKFSTVGGVTEVNQNQCVVDKATGRFYRCDTTRDKALGYFRIDSNNLCKFNDFTKKDKLFIAYALSLADKKLSSLVKVGEVVKEGEPTPKPRSDIWSSAEDTRSLIGRQRAVIPTKKPTQTPLDSLSITRAPTTNKLASSPIPAFTTYNCLNEVCPELNYRSSWRKDLNVYVKGNQYYKNNDFSDVGFKDKQTLADYCGCLVKTTDPCEAKFGLGSYCEGPTTKCNEDSPKGNEKCHLYYRCCNQGEKYKLTIKNKCNKQVDVTLTSKEIYKKITIEGAPASFLYTKQDVHISKNLQEPIRLFYYFFNEYKSITLDVNNKQDQIIDLTCN